MLPVALGRPGIALQLFLLALPVFTFMFEPLSSLYSRRHEFEADAFATRHASAVALTLALVTFFHVVVAVAGVLAILKVALGGAA